MPRKKNTAAAIPPAKGNLLRDSVHLAAWLSTGERLRKNYQRSIAFRPTLTDGLAFSDYLLMLYYALPGVKIKTYHVSEK
jgi:hypothetical protein